MTTEIDTINARQILDSRGNPTVECDVYLSDGSLGRASVPSGASTGINEAVEIRDGGESWMGKGVQSAVDNIHNKIYGSLVGIDAQDQSLVDSLMIELDGTENKSLLGANATLAVSLAVARAAANSSRLPLFRYLGGLDASVMPTPMFNIINGGHHADNNVDFQEFMIQPWGFDNFTDGLRATVEVYHTLKRVLKSQGLSTAVGDEGGFAPNLSSNEHAIEVIEESVDLAGYLWGTHFKVALDPAMSELASAAESRGQSGYCFFSSDPEKILSTSEMISFWEDWCDRFPICSIEDGLGENDWDGWTQLNKKIGSKVQIVGDDLFCTNPNILKKGIDLKSANAILIKVNQIGTLTEALETVSLAQKNGYQCVISHRSGETEDTTISDLSVATNCGQIKTGAPCRSDRNAKFNQLIRIGELLDRNK